VQAAAVNTGLFTAYFALVELAHLQRQQHVVISAASSSMGIAAIDNVFFGLDEYAAAHRYMETNNQIGKVVTSLPA
jgi:hypothetical protein